MTSTATGFPLTGSADERGPRLLVVFFATAYVLAYVPWGLVALEAASLVCCPHRLCSCCLSVDSHRPLQL